MIVILFWISCINSVRYIGEELENFDNQLIISAIFKWKMTLSDVSIW